MTERQLQFRVGLLVIAATIAGVGLLFRFGEFRGLWEENYALSIRFGSAPGVERGTPVRKNGIRIGRVREIEFDDEHGGVLVHVEIRQAFPLRKDSRAGIVRSLLGDATIEFTAGQDPRLVNPGDLLEGETPQDPLAQLETIQETVTHTLASFESTSAEWRKVGQNVNGLVQTHRGNIEELVEQAALSLAEFTAAMQNTNRLLEDPESQAQFKRALAGLPRMVEETRAVVQKVGKAVETADAALANVNELTSPLARRSASIALRLESVFSHLDELSAELAQFSKALNGENSALRQFVEDPRVYNEAERSIASLNVLLRNLEQVSKDLRVFSDKIARHPELIGAGGALKGSSGLK
jgi:phospholipid/cholesterol/gamma-HCH transport system substrate-binding protein